MGGKGLNLKQKKFIIEEKLITLVKERPVLYQKTHPHHHNALTVTNAWTKIYEEIGVNEVVKSGVECAEMWKSLWAQYLCHKRKVEGKTGKSGGKRASFRHEFNMREFDDKVYKEQTMTNVGDNEEEIVKQLLSDENGNSVIVLDILDEASSRALDAETSKNQNESANSTTLKGETPRPIQQPRTHDKRKLGCGDLEKELIGVLKTNNDMDEFDHFGATVAAKLRKLNSTNKKICIHAQFKVNEVILHAEESLEQN